jgi:integrase
MSIGGIYSDSRCPLCGSAYVDDKKSALRCPDHPQHIAGRFKVKIRGSSARFDSYAEATQYLRAKREDVANGIHKVTTLTLGEVVDEFLNFKRDLVKMRQIKASTVRTYRARLGRITGYLGLDTKVDKITYRDLHSWIYGSDYAPKAIYDTYVVFKEMVLLAHDLGDWPTLPKFPPWRLDLDKVMKKRKTIDKAMQTRILDEIYKFEWARAPRLYIGIKFLCTYINVRPGELLSTNEDDLNRQEGILVIRNHKTGITPKVVRLLREDVDLLNTLPRGVPGMPLFRHDHPVQRVKVGARFGQAAFSRSWKRACDHLGIKGVDLYGGTRHSSAIALYREAGFSPETVKKATGHRTSSSFNRYFNVTMDDVAEIHRAAAPKSGYLTLEYEKSDRGVFCSLK